MTQHRSKSCDLPVTFHGHWAWWWICMVIMTWLSVTGPANSTLKCSLKRDAKDQCRSKHCVNELTKLPVWLESSNWIGSNFHAIEKSRQLKQSARKIKEKIVIEGLIISIYIYIYISIHTMLLRIKTSNHWSCSSEKRCQRSQSFTLHNIDFT